jgi:polygalacturonase
MCLLLVLLILLLPAGHSRSQLSDCDVRTYGARCDNSTDDTAALQVAIDACAPQRRRVVIGSAGVCLSRPLTLRSHTELVVAKGTTLKALRNKLADTPFVYAVNATGISVLGNGTIDGSGAQWWAARRSNKALGRPHLIRFDNVSHVLLENLTLLNAANHFTNLHGSHYRIYGLSIRSPSSHIAPNTDGINTKCTDVHIRGCDITNGDDSVVMKAPSIDVLVEDTIVRQGNGFVVGTADDTFEHSFKNITFRRSIAEGTMFGAHVIISSRAARADPSMVCSLRISLYGIQHTTPSVSTRTDRALVAKASRNRTRRCMSMSM